MNGSRHIEENKYLKGFVRIDDIHYSPMNARANEVYCPLDIETSEIFPLVSYKANDFYSSVIASKNHCFPIRVSEDLPFWSFKANEDFINISSQAHYLTGCEVLNSSSLLYERSVKYLNNDFLYLPNIVNEFNRDISNLEVKISSELKSLSEKEAKWTSLSDFAEEYKRAFEITDEELWFEFGHELYTIAYEIHSINLTKKLFYASIGYIERAKKIIYSLSKRINLNHRCEFRHQIAFSTKNLDDEHTSETKVFGNSTFIKSDFVFNEKEKNYKTFAFSLQGGSSKGTKRCSARSN
jgi:hypothetical protein